MVKKRKNAIAVVDGGATSSLIVYDITLTLDELDILQGIDGVVRVLPDNNAFTVVFKVDSFLDVNISAVVKAQRTIKKALQRQNIFSSISVNSGV